MVICNVKECKKKAHYGYIHKEPLKCGTHRADDMENMSHDKCKCGRQPNFGYINEKQFVVRTVKKMI